MFHKTQQGYITIIVNLDELFRKLIKLWGELEMNQSKEAVSFEYNQRKVDKVSLVLIIVLAAIIIMQAFLKGEGRGQRGLIQTLPVIGLTILVYFLPIKRFLKSLLFGVIPFLAVCAAIFMSEFSADRLIMLCICTVMIALYFDRKCCRSIASYAM